MEQNLGPRGPRTSLSGVQGDSEKAVKHALGVNTLGNFKDASPAEKQEIIDEVENLRESFAGQDPKLFYEAVCKLLGISKDGKGSNKSRSVGAPLTSSLAEFLQKAGIAGSGNKSDKKEILH